MDNININNENMPPWDINKVSQNPIDHKFTFMQQPDIFSIAQNNTQPLQQTTQQPNKTTLNNTKDYSDISIPKITKEARDDGTEAIALALKYRPKTFAELVGQDSVARTLCLALDSKKIANAYLFSGLRGSGKTSSARILARSLQCESGITSSPCGVCANCIAALKGAHIDITELDGASNRKIDDMRDLIEQTKYKPTMGRFKIFIIDEVHMLTKEAFNSLLKTLEEPPNHVKFILATTDPLKVPATILSRTQHFRFKKIPTIALKNHLSHILQKENVSTDEASLDMLIRNGHGSLRDTLTLLDQAIVFCQNSLTTQKLANMLGALDPNAFDSLFQALLKKDMQECVKFAKSLEGYEIEMILDELSLYIKNKMLEDIPQIPPVLGMRYANIINDSKVMLHLDCDSDFCLLLTILKMLEAQKIREVANALKQLESMQTPAQSTQISQLSNDYMAAQETLKSTSISQNKAMQQNLQQTLTQESTQKNQITQNIAQDSNTLVESNTIQNTNSIQANTKMESTQHSINHNIKQKSTTEFINSQQETTNKQPFSLTKNDNLFETLITKLYERDYNIGSLFQNKISFDKFTDNVLHLTFYTTEEETLILRQAYSGIMQVMKEVYGDSIKMQVVKQSPKDLANLMQNNEAANSKTLSNEEINNKSSSIEQETQNLNTESNNHQIQNKAKNTDPAMQFIEQNSDILKSMQNELGIKDVKIISLDNL